MYRQCKLSSHWIHKPCDLMFKYFPGCPKPVPAPAKKSNAGRPPIVRPEAPFDLPAPKPRKTPSKDQLVAFSLAHPLPSHIPHHTPLFPTISNKNSVRNSIGSQNVGHPPPPHFPHQLFFSFKNTKHFSKLFKALI